MRVLSAVRQCPRPADFQTVSEKTAGKVLDVVKMSIFFGSEQNGSLVQRFRFFLFTEKRLEGHVFEPLPNWMTVMEISLLFLFHEDRAHHDLLSFY